MDGRASLDQFARSLQPAPWEMPAAVRTVGFLPRSLTVKSASLSVVFCVLCESVCRLGYRRLGRRFDAAETYRRQSEREAVGGRARIVEAALGPAKTSRTGRVRGKRRSPAASGREKLRRGSSTAAASSVTRHLLHTATGNRCVLIERLRPTKNSIRWEIEIRGQGKPWSTAIETRLQYPATPATRFWTTWSDSGLAVPGGTFPGNGARRRSATSEPTAGIQYPGWTDPLAADAAAEHEVLLRLGLY